jgi:hypothetical protein
VTGAQLERRDIRATIRRIYETERGAAGCCLHIITDDGNYDDQAVTICLQQAEESGHIMCRTVARFLEHMTQSERRRFLRRRRS